MPDEGRRQFEHLYSSAQRELGEALVLLRASQEECARLTEERDRLRRALSAPEAEQGRRSVPERARAWAGRGVRKLFRRR